METLLDTPEVILRYGWYFHPKTNTYKFYWGLLLITLSAEMMAVMPDDVVEDILTSAGRHNILTD